MIKVLEAFGEPISYGGQESFVFKTIEAMNKDNLRFDFLTPYFCDNSDYRNFVKSINSKIYSFNLPFEPGKNRFNVIKPYCELLKKNKYDVVHINSGSISILALMTFLAKKNNVKKVIVHSHMAGIPKNKKHEIIKKVFSPIFKHYADVLIAPSNEAANWQFAKKLFKQKGILLKNGIELNKYIFNSEIRNSYRSKLGYLKNDFLLGTVGRLSEEKNQKFLIKLLRYILNKKIDAKLLIVGDGKEKEGLKQLCKKLKVENQVQFVGNVNDVQNYLQAMDVFLFPSKYEGLGIASIEAQVAGLPVIASENVPRDIKITENVKFLKTDINFDKWYSEIVTLHNQQLNRSVNINTIKDSGYSVITTASKLKDVFQ